MMRTRETRARGCFILFFLSCCLVFFSPVCAISAGPESSKDVEVIRTDTAASPETAASFPGSAQPQAAAEVVAENLVGEEVEDASESEDKADAGDDTETCVITCRTKIALVETVGDKPVMVDRFSTVMFDCPLPVREAFDRAIKLAEKDLDPDKVTEVSFTCEFP